MLECVYMYVQGTSSIWDFYKQVNGTAFEKVSWEYATLDLR